MKEILVTDPGKPGGLLPFLISQFVSLVGDRVSTLAYVSLAAAAAPAQGGAAAANVAAIQIVPVLALSYFGGWLSDRFIRKWLMIGIDVLRFSLVLAFVALFEVSHGVWPVYGAVFLLGSLSALFNPAKRSLLPFLVTRAEIPRANWWLVNSEVLAMVSGLAAGTLLLNTFSPARALLLDATSFFLALVILFWVPSVGRSTPSTEPQMPLLQGLRGGWEVLRQIPALRGVLLRLNLPFFVAAGLFYASSTNWSATMQPENAGASLGRLLLALAAGALAAFPLRRWLELVPEPKGSALAFALGAVCLLAVAGLEGGSFPALASAVFATGIAVGLLYARSTYLLHLAAPPAALGRLVSLRELLGALGFTLTIGLTSALGSRFSARSGWIAAAAVFTLGCVGMARARVMQPLETPV